ncbi:MAG TPA: CBS domain-containing protein [Terriglobales bacterium]|nr:CBS domain-containing protein [Terriglobales bacterium]
MTTDLITLQMNDTLRLADDLMNLAKVRHFPVLHEGKVAGLLDQLDLLHASMRSIVRHRNRSPRLTLATVAIRDVMKPATTVSASMTLHQTARLMIHKDIDCVLVVEAGRLVGLATRTDLLRGMTSSYGVQR